RCRHLYQRDPSGKRLPGGATRWTGPQAGAIFDTSSIGFHWTGLQRSARRLRHRARLRTSPSEDGFHDRRYGGLSAAALEFKAPKLKCQIRFLSFQLYNQIMLLVREKASLAERLQICLCLIT